jgi:hypothetical protein
MGIIYKKLILIFISIVFPLFSLFAFEGIISYVKESKYDTTYNIYYIKDNNVRIEEYDKDKNLQNVVLIDINKETSILINPEKKQYKENNKCDQLKKLFDNNFEINKTDNYKIINGVKCFQWRVRNTQLNTEISYWVTQSKIEFYNNLLNNLYSSENSNIFFMQIPDNKGYYPMVTEERTLLRDEKQRTTLVDIKSKQMNNNLFIIPSNYKLFVL